MAHDCTIQLFAAGAWHDVGSVSLLSAEAHGRRSKTYTGYAVAWAIEHGGARDAHAFASRFPVGLQAFQQPHWPVFLIDMLPQGFGREELLRRLNLSPMAAESVDWRLLLAGAGNPVGNLRVKEAATWLSANAGPIRGFTDDVVAERGDDFVEYLASHGLFVAGSSGVQGEWPKILLTRADDGLLYLDHSLPDARAREHYIVKFGRGKDEALATILRQEAPYMALARMLGLRVHADLVLRLRALYIPRFDRQVTNGGVLRLGQESIATLTGIPGFGAVPSHDEVCRQLLLQCTRPLTEVLEYIKRDVANLALGNKDNHARNTAVQRDFSGGIRLTPLYDFAPMYLHPDGIARRIRWDDNDSGAPDWSRVIDRVCEMAQTLMADKRTPSAQKKALREVSRPTLVEGLRLMVGSLETIAAHGTDFGLEPAVHAHLKLGIEAQAKRLAELN
jgi:serine/threonine-protein kinase HipA